MMQRILVTGGAGVIGSALIRHLVVNTDACVLNIDKLTYAGHLSSLAPITTHGSPDQQNRYQFIQADIADGEAMHAAINQFRPDTIMNLAAESHVDRSIYSPAEFIQTNISGTYILLQTALEYWDSLSSVAKQQFRFHHISTDEVYGSLGQSGLFCETTAYNPRSPYSASKAASDHLVKAWFHTYRLPVVVSNCANNFGPYQHPEKLIPKTILNALAQQPIPIYGDGQQIRDWLYIDDHIRALLRVVGDGELGETYNIGARNECSNLTLVQSLCDILQVLKPAVSARPYRSLIHFVDDRKGHDRRYAIDASKIEQQLGWQAEEGFDTGLRKTVQWYLDNRNWWQAIVDDD